MLPSLAPLPATAEERRRPREAPETRPWCAGTFFIAIAPGGSVIRPEPAAAACRAARGASAEQGRTWEEYDGSTNR